MTPKDKAAELVAKFADTETDITFLNSDRHIEVASGYLTKNAAKQAALIAVEEILSNTISGTGAESYKTIADEIQCDEEFWNSVKTEIINL